MENYLEKFTDLLASAHLNLSEGEFGELLDYITIQIESYED